MVLKIKRSYIMKSMIKRIFYFCIFIFLYQEHTNAKEAPFNSGEKITYKLYYNWNFVWLSAGEVAFEVKDEGDVYHIEVTGKTYSSYEWFYKVRDKYHSYIDKKTLLPKLFIRDIHQGSYVHYEKVIFDYPNNKMISSIGKSMSQTTTKEIPLTSDVYDLVSSMYFLRQTNLDILKINKTVNFNMILDNEIYNLGMSYLKEEPKCSVKENGKYNALLCNAEVISGSVFKDGAKMKINIGYDENKLPLIIESPLTVGSVKALLMSYENLKFPLNSKHK
jgi:hypothetical protein